MDTLSLFNIATKVDSPLMISGFAIIVMFLIYRAVIKSNIFPTLTKKQAYDLINKILVYLFVLAIFALFLGASSYIYVQTIESKDKEKDVPIEMLPLETIRTEITPPKFPSSEETQRLTSKSVHKDFSVIHFIVVKEKPFPIIKVTLKNDTKKAQVITKLKAVIHEYAPYIASPISVRLEPLVVWNIELPYDEGIYPYNPANPILIPSDNAASISLRLFQTERDRPIPPHIYGHFILKFVFVSDSNIEAETQFFILWNNKVLTK